MQAARPRDDEAAALAALRGLDVLDSGPEAEFDALVRAASLICGTPISIISLVDSERQWFKANIGLPGVSETPRDVAFCAHAVLTPELFEVPDATQDPRFVDNPLVAGAPDIRFYAGAPLTLSSGERIGTICVIDRQPRQLDAKQREVLGLLAQAAAQALEGRRAIRANVEAVREAARAALVLQHSADAIIGLDDARRVVRWNPAAERLFGHRADQIIGGNMDRLVPPDRASEETGLLARLADGQAHSYETVRLRKDGQRVHVAVTAVPEFEAQGRLCGATKFVRDISQRVSEAQKLAASEDRMRRRYESTPAMLHSIDTAGRLLAVSDHWLAKMGYTRSEVIGRPAQDFVTPESRGRSLCEVMPKMFTEGRIEGIDFQMVTRDGRALDVLVSAVVERDAAGRPLHSLSVVEDVTERRRVERALHDERERLSSIVEGTQAGTWEYRIAADDYLVNGLYLAMLGEAAETPRTNTGAAFAARVHPDDRPRLSHAWREHLTGRAPGYEAEYRMCHRDGHWVWMLSRGKVVARDASGRALRASGIHLDISALVQTREMAQAARHDLRAILDAVPSMIGYWDRQLVNRFANRAYHDWFGRQPDTLPGTHISQLLGETIYRRNLPHIEAALSGQAQTFERAIPRPDGSGERHAQTRYLPDVRDGVVQGFYVLVFDITAIKQAQEQLEGLNGQLVERTRQAEAASDAKSAFLANMSHEIRTPMNAILGMLTLLQKTALTPRQADYAGKTEGAARALLGLLNDILDFSKVEAGKMLLDLQPFRFDPLLRDLSVILAANVGRKDVEVLFDLDPMLPAGVVGDVTRLRQVLINLGGNAIKFTERGEVVVAIAVVARDAQQVTLEVSVRDSGIGIAPENQQRIFSGFTQAEASTTRRFGGTGLGLAICQRLVAMMGSELCLDSAPGQGSRFHFRLTLPVAAVPDDDAAGAGARHTPAAGPMPRVLVVDDNPTAREALRRMADGLGWRVETVDGGERALRWLREAREPFDAIFIDWQMPGLDGWQTCRQLREQRLSDSTPLLVMVTAHGREMLAQRPDEEQGLLAGLLVKPVTATMLRDALAEARGEAQPLGVARRTAGVSARRLAGLRLLVAEDNANNQQVARELLEDEGAEVQIAVDGRAAVEAVAAAQPPFDAVLMDLQMPVMDGYTATGCIRQDLGQTALPIIAMTANAMASDRDACLAAGMSDHIGKPFDLDKLVRVLRRLTGRGDSPHAPAQRATLAPELLAAAREAGIDLPTALARLGGQTAVYARLLRSFVGDLRAMPAQLAQNVAAGASVEAGRLLHTLKGLAATLGADTLAAEAGHAEAHFAKPAAAGSAHSEPQLRRLAAAVDTVLPGMTRLHEALAVAARAHKAGSAGSAGGAAGPLDAAALLQALHGLAQALGDSDMSAIALMQALQDRHAAALGDDLQPLDDAVAALDFAAALTHCTRLIETHTA